MESPTPAGWLRIESVRLFRQSEPRAHAHLLDEENIGEVSPAMLVERGVVAMLIRQTRADLREQAQ